MLGKAILGICTPLLILMAVFWLFGTIAEGENPLDILKDLLAIPEVQWFRIFFFVGDENDHGLYLRFHHEAVPFRILRDRRSGNGKYRPYKAYREDRKSGLRELDTGLQH